ncbi:MAG: hypothetical protein HZA54_06640 [Planctomycetes bacterium]|nr:hypothetical protein [Planctomycetota bacterium]
MKILSPLVQSCILLFWLAMTGLLVKREILPGLWLEADPSYAAALSRRLTTEDTHTRIECFGRRVGDSRTTIRPESDGTYLIETLTRMDAGVPELAGLTIHSLSTVDFTYRLRRVTVALRSAAANATLRGFVHGDELELITETEGGERRVERMPYVASGTASNGLSPFINMPHLTVGKSWNIQMIDPFTQHAEWTTARVEELVEIRWNDRPVECFLVTARAGGRVARAWIDREGRILREEPFPGLVMIREVR